MLSLDLWPLLPDPSGVAQRIHSRQHLSFKDALRWLRETPDTTHQPREWRIAALTAHIDGHDGIAKYIIPLTRLVGGLGFDPDDARTVADTVAFNGYIDDPQKGDLPAGVRCFSLSDNTFGIYWAWQPSHRCTKVFMYGMTGEGTRQMQSVWKRLSALPARQWANPLIVGTAALEAEVVEMKRWVAGQSDELVSLHIRTGHHDYARREKRDVDTTGLSEMSRDVCGFAINISTSVLCLQRILKFADFLLEECEELDNLLQQNRLGSTEQDLREVLRKSQSAVKSQTRVWRRRADALLDEAETWKGKASILVQTVFTLATQRDTGISIQIAQDSRTLAQKATRDSTSMKAIAAVTMCFLPGTFVAVRSRQANEWCDATDHSTVALRHAHVRLASHPRADGERSLLGLLGRHASSHTGRGRALAGLDQPKGSTVGADEDDHAEECGARGDRPRLMLSLVLFERATQLLPAPGSALPSLVRLCNSAALSRRRGM